MDYEKKYKKLVSKIEKAYLYAQTDSTKAVLEEIRPELKESEPIDKVEPKFKVGDWIVINGIVLKIQEVHNDLYDTTLQNGELRIYDTYILDNDAHLWTIEDAKDGDVLQCENFIFIFKDYDKESDTVVSYCDKNIREGIISFKTVPMCRGIEALPATKEQYDTLFTKMKESRYEWDAEKLVLKIVNPSEPDLVRMKELDKIWDKKQDPILQRLDRIYDLLLHKLNEKIIINNPFPRLTETPYKLGEIWCDSASASTEKKTSHD